MRTAVVIGSGAGGATVAKELQGTYDVTVLDAGRPYRRCTLDRHTIDLVGRSRVLRVDPGLIRAPYPALRVRRTDDMLIVRGIGLGGTTTVATGNGVRADDGLRAVGLDLDEEFADIERQIPISTEHRHRWHPITRRLFRAADDLGLAPMPTPKMGAAARCRHCGRCVLGCPYGIKWDARRFLDDAVARGARVSAGTRVDRIAIEGGRAIGVLTGGASPRAISADLVVVAAGGFGTPAILERSGIRCEPTLSVDPVLTIAARLPRSWQCSELEMPFVVRRDRYILSPYFDWLSYVVDPRWRHPPEDIVGVMVKIADEGGGRVDGRHIRTRLTSADRLRLEAGAGVAREMLRGIGINPETTFEGVLNGGHPGGTLPLTPATAASLHDDRLPANVYVADASLFPRSLGLPPILTIVALAKRVARLLRDREGSTDRGSALAPCA